LLALHLSGEAAAEPEAVRELAGLCGYLPLALRNAAARAVARPGLPLAALVTEIRLASKPLDALETGEPNTSVRAVFSWSRARLRVLSERMFRLLGIHPGPDITVSAAASLAALSPGEAHLALDELCDKHLLTEYMPGRYTCHSLLRWYAAEEAENHESEADRGAALHRALDHYLQGAIQASGLLEPDQPGLAWPSPLPEVALEELSGHANAADWFENERPVLLAMIRKSAEARYAPYAWELPWIAGWYFQDRATWRTLAAAQESALVVAGKLNDAAGLAMASQHLGWLYFLLGDAASAWRHLANAVYLADWLDAGQLSALTSLNQVYVRQVRARVRDVVARAPRTRQISEDSDETLRALYAIGRYLAQLGDDREAVSFSTFSFMESYASPGGAG
jgi:hypothetical protein